MLFICADTSHSTSTPVMNKLDCCDEQNLIFLLGRLNYFFGYSPTSPIMHHENIALPMSSELGRHCKYHHFLSNQKFAL